MTSKKLPISVITPTFNREHTLERLFKSLCNQDTSLFNWIVVDDGSTDNSKKLLEELKAIAPFPVKLLSQKNQGKHIAHNNAVEVAEGQLSVVLDSDDELSPNSIELIWKHWISIDESEKSMFAGIIGHSVDQDGNFVGNRLNQPFIDGHLFELQTEGIVAGEKLNFFRTKILKDYPFPHSPLENDHVTEGLVWLRIARSYKVRCIEQDVRVYHQDKSDLDSLTNKFSSPQKGSWGLMMYNLEIINFLEEYFPKYLKTFIVSSILFQRYAFHSKYYFFKQFKLLTGNKEKIMWLLTIELGFFFWLKDRMKLYRKS